VQAMGSNGSLYPGLSLDDVVERAVELRIALEARVMEDAAAKESEKSAKASRTLENKKKKEEAKLRKEEAERMKTEEAERKRFEEAEKKKADEAARPPKRARAATNSQGPDLSSIRRRTDGGT